MYTQTILGIDEAGRGCLVGPLVMCGVVLSDDDQRNYLRKIGVRDSKLFGGNKHTIQQRRQQLYEEIKKVATHVFVNRVTALQINSTVKSLDSLEIELAWEIISWVLGSPFILGDDGNLTVVLDGHDMFEEMEKDSDNHLLITSVNHADEQIVEVSAASIVAKHLRDQMVLSIMGDYFWNGAGYCNDGTIKWLRSGEAWAVQDFIRQSWSWWDKVKKELRQ